MSPVYYCKPLFQTTDARDEYYTGTITVTTTFQNQEAPKKVNKRKRKKITTIQTTKAGSFNIIKILIRSSINQALPFTIIV